MQKRLGSNYYEYTMTVEHTLETLYYEISAKDTSNNWYNTETVAISLNDNDAPEITDNTNNLATTGDLFTFTGTVTDNIQITNVYLEYWYNTDTHTNESMTNTLDDDYEKTITIDNTLGELHYIIIAKDNSNNWNNTATKDLTIRDNDLPQITNVKATPNSQEHNRYVNITCDVTDNIEVQTVKVDISGPPGSTHITTTMNKGSYYYNTSYNIIGTYTYYIWAKDTSNNIVTSSTNTFNIGDSIPPEIIDDSPTSAKTGENVDLAFTYIALRSISIS